MQFKQENSESDWTSITGFSMLDVFEMASPPSLTLRMDWSRNIKEDFMLVMLQSVTFETVTSDRAWIDSKEI